MPSLNRVTLIGWTHDSALGVRIGIGEFPPTRQDTGCKLSVEKTNTPLNAMFRGVFRSYLLTSTT